jgi:acid phosphatase family membrane protein YuiD
MNYALVIGILSVIISQTTKIITTLIAEKKILPWMILSNGGMPSSHTAFVISVTISIALTVGMASPVFAVAAMMAMIVINDAMGVRYEAGKHAFVLNQLIADLKELSLSDLPNDKKLKELLGHKPIEVFGGIVAGTIVAIIGYFLIYPHF